MRALTVAKIMWLTSLLIVAGCTVKAAQEEQPIQQAGSGAIAGMVGTAAGVGGMMAAGMDGQVVGTGGAAGVGTGGVGAAGVGGVATGGVGGVATGGVGGVGTGGTDADAMVPPAGTPLVDCVVQGTEEPCSSYETLRGTVVEMGPYGGQMVPNVGAEFANPVNAQDMSPANCQLFAAIFGEPADEVARLLDVQDLDFSLYTVYRPVNWAEGEKFPLITWGNGTCAQPEGYGTLLRFVASHGFIVVAANTRWVGDGTRPMNKALDFMLAENDNPESPYYQRIDPEKIGAMGHSQGSAATATAASDARIKAVILFNGGTSASKPFLAVSGDMDTGSPTVTSYRNPVMNGTGKAAFLFYHMIPVTGTQSGHLTLMKEPWRVTDATAAWWKLILNNDPVAREMFVGDNCGLCNMDASFEFGQKNL